MLDSVVLPAIASVGRTSSKPVRCSH
jgi:hypothetical protein